MPQCTLPEWDNRGRTVLQDLDDQDVDLLIACVKKVEDHDMRVLNLLKELEGVKNGEKNYLV